jgi:hypothetical protein
MMMMMVAFIFRNLISIASFTTNQTSNEQKLKSQENHQEAKRSVKLYSFNCFYFYLVIFKSTNRKLSGCRRRSASVGRGLYLLHAYPQLIFTHKFLADSTKQNIKPLHSRKPENHFMNFIQTEIPK